MQERLILEYAKKKALNVDPRKFILTESGWMKERRGFREMLDFVRTNHIPNLLTLNEERLCRDFRSYVFLNDLIDQGLKIHFVETGQVIDGQDPDKLFIWQIKVAMAAKFIHDLKAKVSRGFAGKFAKGEYLTRPPLGYLTKHGKLEKDKSRAPSITQAFELYATGLYSLKSLRDELHNRGFRTLRDGMVTVPTLHSILRNDLYVGVLRREGQTRLGVHEPLVDQRLFEKVQRQLVANAHTYPMKDHWYPYRGLLVCGICGCRLTAEAHKGHVYYRCSQGKARQTGQRCPQAYYRQEKLEAIFTKALKGFQFDEELVKWAESVIVYALAEGDRGHDVRRKALQDEYNKNRTMLRRIIDDRAHGRFSLQLLEEKHKELQARQVDIELELARVEENSGEKVQDILSVMDLLRNLSETFRRADAERKHKILRFVLEKVVVGKQGWKFHWSPTFRYFYGLKTHKDLSANPFFPLFPCISTTCDEP
jgi:DNA invertase Pin-like site-specific DNA recombinase